MVQAALLFLTCFFQTIILHEMRQFAVTLLLLTGCALHAGAQSFLNELKGKRQGEGTVTVNQSREIDELVNNAKLVKSVPTAPAQQQATSKEAATGGTAHRHEQAGREPAGDTAKATHHATDDHTVADTPAATTGKKVMRNSRKVTGYRIQAYSGGNSREDRQKAESIGSAIKSRFPSLPVYVHFYSPRWICRVGNFRTYQEAESILKELKSMGYKQACIVKGKITVAY